MARILAVDDEPAIRNLLARVLIKDGHDVRCAACAEEALAAHPERYDLVLLDVMMPGMDGFELCRIVRQRTDAPIVFLTAKAAEEDAVFGLGVGADDYMRKPFGAAELRAKVAAHLRRERRERTHALTFDDVRLDLGSRRAYVAGAEVALTPSEYAICEFLARHPGQVFSRDQIAESAFGWDVGAKGASVPVHVGNLRAKFKERGVDPLRTVWGMGYAWNL